MTPNEKDEDLLKKPSPPAPHPEYPQFTRDVAEELINSRLKATEWKRQKRFELYKNALKK